MKISLDIYIVIALVLHSIINGAIAGYYLADEMPFKEKRGLALLLMIGFAVIGIEICTLIIIAAMIKSFLNWLNCITQIQFYWEFYLTKKYNVLTDAEWKNVEDQAKHIQNRERKGISGRHFEFCYSLLKKRHGKA